MDNYSSNIKLQGQQKYKLGMYMKSSLAKNSYAQQSYFKDPLNIETMRYKYLRSPYDSAATRIRTDNGLTRIRTQYRDSGYLYEKQLLRLQKQALESQLKQQKRSGSKKQAMKTIQDFHIKNMNKEDEHKKRDNYYEDSSAIRQKNKTLSSYEDIYKKDIGSPNRILKYPQKMNYSMLGSPQPDPSNLSKCIEDTSDTKAVIFRRLYDHKSKPLKNKSELSQRIQKKISKQGSQGKDEVESICESNEATFLEEISFLKAQLQEKNKTIVDLQCQLIKKSAPRHSQRQRHKSDFGVSSLYQSHIDKNQDLQAKVTRVRELQIEQKNIDLRIESQLIPMPKSIRNLGMLQSIKIEGKIKDSIGTNTQVKKARQLQLSGLKHERVKGQSKLFSQTQIQTEEPPRKTLTYTKQFTQTISPLEQIHAQQIQKYKQAIKSRMGQSNSHQIRIDAAINNDDPGETTKEDSKHILKEDKQCQTSDNMYDYIEEAYLQWVFEKDYQELQARKQKQQEGKH